MTEYITLRTIPTHVEAENVLGILLQWAKYGKKIDVT